MKQLLLIMLVCYAMPASANITVGSSWEYYQADGISISLTVAPTNGHTLWVTCGIGNTGYTITSMVDNNSVALSLDKFSDNGARSLGIWHETNVSGVTSVTLTMNLDPGSMDCAAIDIAGLSATPGDTFEAAITAGNANPFLSGSITTTNASDIVIGAMYHPGGTTTLTSNAPWTFVVAGGMGIAYQIVSSTGAYNPSAANVGGGTCYGLTGSYKASAGGATPNMPAAVY